MSQRSGARLRAALLAAPIAALALVLAACGGPVEAGALTSASAQPAGSEPESERRGAVVIEHVQGVVELDGVPQSVFSFDWGVTQDLMALGVPVDGIPKWVTPPSFEELAQTEGVIDIGTVFEPDSRRLPLIPLT